jgi:hypothetical protein
MQKDYWGNCFAIPSDRKVYGEEALEALMKGLWTHTCMESCDGSSYFEEYARQDSACHA